MWAFGRIETGRPGTLSLRAEGTGGQCRKAAYRG
jgi:hypothetical protein